MDRRARFDDVRTSRTPPVRAPARALAGSVSGCGVRMTGRSRNKPASAAAGPRFPSRAIGWLGTNHGGMTPPLRRPSSTLPLTLPTSITVDAVAPKWTPAIRRTSGAIAFVGTANEHRVRAAAIAASRSATTASISPSCNAAAAATASESYPVDLSRSDPALRIASANDRR